MSKIGFIGLGIMGKPMLRNLRKAGHEIVAYDVFPAAVDEALKDGAERGASCKDVAARSEIVITMLPDGPEVEQAVLGPGGVLEGAHAGLILVDMSSISPIVAQKVAAACAAKGVDFRIEIDGGVDLHTVGPAVRAGAEILVAGSHIFGRGNPTENAEALLRVAQEATLLRA